MINAYFTVGNDASAELTVNKSRFIAFAYGAETTEYAAEKIKALRKEYYGATHVCYAYVIGADGGAQKFSDDGEPQGTAGLPIAEVLKNRGLKDSLVAVVRYFGGKKLGTGGLIRAYTEAAVLAVLAAGASERVYCDFVCVEYGFAAGRKLLAYPIAEKVYGEGVTVTYAVPVAERERFLAALSESTGGGAVYRTLKTDYFRVPAARPSGPHKED
jgi:uncharacterized YigZ family protein